MCRLPKERKIGVYQRAKMSIKRKGLQKPQRHKRCGSFAQQDLMRWETSKKMWFMKAILHVLSLKLYQFIFQSISLKSLKLCVKTEKRKPESMSLQSDSWTFQILKNLKVSLQCVDFQRLCQRNISRFWEHTICTWEATTLYGLCGKCKGTLSSQFA